MKIKFILLVCLLLLPFISNSEEINKKPRLLSSDQGSFVFGQVSDARVDQYMLDTKTGRLWKLNTDSGKYVLEEVLYVDDKKVKTKEPN